VDTTKAIAALKLARDALDEAIATLEALARDEQADTEPEKVIEILRVLKRESMRPRNQS
jgi:hypothetical protein